MKSMYLTLLIICTLGSVARGQGFNIKGNVINENAEPLAFVTVVLFNLPDSTFLKGEVTDESGSYVFTDLQNGNYFIRTQSLGMMDHLSQSISVLNKDVILPPTQLISMQEVLEEVVISGQRRTIEVKADRTIFNVQGTINSSGDNALNLLRKAPGVMVDNQNNLVVMGRSGVMVYVDGKRLPLSGDDLSSYLQNLTAEQIEKFEIITNPGSMYEAQGNAGIIDIRLRKSEDWGSNATISSSVSKGRYTTGNLGFVGNYKNKLLNAFGNAQVNGGKRFSELVFNNLQNGLDIDDETKHLQSYSGLSSTLGADVSLADGAKIGVQASGQLNLQNAQSNNSTSISRITGDGMPDSILIANNSSDSERNWLAFNTSYDKSSGNKKWHAEANYGLYDNMASYIQPNNYFSSDGSISLSSREVRYTTPVGIQLLSGKADYSFDHKSGKYAMGYKISNVTTDNSYLFNNIVNDNEVFNPQRSSDFTYGELVNAAYLNYSGSLSKTIELSAGLRAEHTQTLSKLNAHEAAGGNQSVRRSYLNMFPTLGVRFAGKSGNSLSFQYGRRINRPDYQLLNPFKIQVSETSYTQGNSFLRPEIVNNVELGYTLQYRFTFKVAYSQTNDQMTRLLGPDEADPRAGYLTWENLASQKIYSGSASLPFDVTKWWNCYLSLSASLTDNTADYGGGKTVDVRAAGYSIYQQHTFKLGKHWKGEFSSWYSGPGVWGGVFLYDPSYSLDFGLQRKFLNDKLNLRITASDVTYQSGWSGISKFNGQTSYGRGNWDSRRIGLSLSYMMGNTKLSNKKKNTALDAESERISE
ncbi:MAG: TonB-dependent receptor [Saprospiraceae bacterium]|nr:TonB-dependent receptor [Saprospiraceae bacterium]